MINKFKVGDLHIEKWIPNFDDVKKYAALSGDHNPIHIDIDAAKKIGKENIIVHGNLTCSVISKVIGMSFPGKGSVILEQNVSFSNPIFPDDIIKFEFLIESVNYSLSIIEIKLKAFKCLGENNIKKSVVIRGRIICQI